MAYVKPGVEVKQEQVTVSPNLTAPDLVASLIGKPFYVEEVDDYAYESYTDTQKTVDYAGLPDNSKVHKDSVYVDLVVSSGANAGTVYHLSSSDFTAGDTSVSIDAGLSSTYSGVEHSDIKIGYRAVRTGLDDIIYIESIEDIEEEIGKISSMNPLGLGTYIALTNAGNNVIACPVKATGTNAETTNNFTADDMKLSVMGTVEMYALTPLTIDSGTVFPALISHARKYSEPEEKKERIVIANPTIPWTGDKGDDTTNVAALIKSNAYQQMERRLVYVFPDVAYYAETRHVSTLTQTYLDKIQGITGEPAYLNQPYKVTVSGVEYKYKAGTKLTSTVLSNLAKANSFLEVMVPVPGYYVSAAVAGQVGGGLFVSDPHTNVPIGGVKKLKYSTDTFSESDLNIMAEGGNYLMIQNSASSPIYCRHQMTTDTNSVERRELSIIKALDFVAKFIRNGLAGYIGRYNITPQFMKLLNMTLQAQSMYLVREGYVNDIKVLKVEQDETQKDTILVTLNVAVKYPVNYIKITLQF